MAIPSVTKCLAKDIRCAMNGEQYHEVTEALGMIEGRLDLVLSHPVIIDVLDRNAGALVGMLVIEEKVSAAQDLMQAAWDRTTAVQHG